MQFIPSQMEKFLRPRYIFAIATQHFFCCFLPLVGAMVGANIPGLHNPFIELSLAVFGAILGVQIDKFLHSRKPHDCGIHSSDGADATETEPKAKKLFKTYSLPMVFALGAWGVHMAFFHSHHDHTHAHDHNHEHEVQFIEELPYLEEYIEKYRRDGGEGEHEGHHHHDHNGHHGHYGHSYPH